MQFQYLSNNSHLFSENNVNNETLFDIAYLQPNAIKILKAHREYCNNSNNLLSHNDYDYLVNQIDIELNDFEKHIEEEMNKQRRVHVRTKVNDYIRKFNRKLQFQREIGSKGIERIWKVVQTVLPNIKKDLNLKDISIFGTPKYHPEAPSELPIVATTKRKYITKRSSSRKICFNLTKLNEAAKTRIVTSVVDEDLFNCIENKTINTSTNFIRTVPAPLSPLAFFAVWVEYKPKVWNPLQIGSDDTVKDTEATSRMFHAAVSSKLSSILDATSRVNMETSMKLFQHEADQISSGLLSLSAAHLEDWHHFRYLGTDKSKGVLEDLKSYLLQLWFLVKKSQSMSAITDVEMRYLWPRSALLAKLSSVFRLEAEGKDINIIIPKVKANDQLRPQVFGDLMLLELLVYNLLGNAIKYCYRGTNIYVDCKKADELETSPHMISIVDYGLGCQEDDKIYELYERGKNVRKGEIGQGIGLNWAKEIAAQHGGKLRHKSELISKYNVPLIEPYINRQFRGKRRITESALKGELIKLSSNRLYDNILAKYRSGKRKYEYPLDHNLVNEIDSSTYKTTFEAVIPVKRRN